MVNIRDMIEPQIVWKVGEGNVNVWWDNWSGEGAIAELLNIRGKRQAKDLLKDCYENGRFGLSMFGIDVQNRFEGVCLREECRDVAVWKPTGGPFNFKTAKALVRQQGTAGGLWCKKIWAKGVTWKMSFAAWRVFKGKLPVDDVLRRMGYQLASKCPCCVNPGCDSMQHVFGLGA